MPVCGIHQEHLLGSATRTRDVMTIRSKNDDGDSKFYRIKR